MTSLPNYDSWKLASPDYDESDWNCPHCGHEGYTTHLYGVLNDETYRKCENCEAIDPS